jgi:hypothetical protein
VTAADLESPGAFLDAVIAAQQRHDGLWLVAGDREIAVRTVDELSRPVEHISRSDTRLYRAPRPLRTTAGAVVVRSPSAPRPTWRVSWDGQLRLTVDEQVVAAPPFAAPERVDMVDLPRVRSRPASAADTTSQSQSQSPAASAADASSVSPSESAPDDSSASAADSAPDSSSASPADSPTASDSEPPSASSLDIDALIPDSPAGDSSAPAEQTPPATDRPVKCVVTDAAGTRRATYAALEAVYDDWQWVRAPLVPTRLMYADVARVVYPSPDDASLTPCWLFGRDQPPENVSCVDSVRAFTKDYFLHRPGESLSLDAVQEWWQAWHSTRVRGPPPDPQAFFKWISPAAEVDRTGSNRRLSNFVWAYPWWEPGGE